MKPVKLMLNVSSLGMSQRMDQNERRHMNALELIKR